MRRKRNTPRKGKACVYYDKASGRWRVQDTRPDGSRATNSYYSELQAKDIAQALQDQYDNEVQTISDAISLYLEELGDRGVSPEWKTTASCRLRRMFPNRDQRVLCELNDGVAKRLYKELREQCKSVDYHRNCLITSKSMCKWLVEEGHLMSNPFAGVQGKGRRKKGKPQLTTDEARRFLAECVNYRHPIMRADGRNKMRTPELDPQIGVTAAMTCLLMGLRCSDMTRLTPRSVDENGTVLRVEISKTKAGERRLKIPQILQPRMLALTATTLTRYQIYKWVLTIGELADVTRVTPHGLRGTHATLATDAGFTGPAVASALGHESEVVTHAHYNRSSALVDTQIQAAVAKLSEADQGNQCSCLTPLNREEEESAHKSAHEQHINAKRPEVQLGANQKAQRC